MVAVVLVALLASVGGLAALVARPMGPPPRARRRREHVARARRDVAARPALARFYSQRLDWSPCQDEFLCAT